MWLLVWIATFLLVSSVIGYFTFKFNKSGKDPLWFRTLVKSRLEPPGYVYGIVFPLQDISLAILGWNLSSMPEFIEGYQYFWIQMVLKWIYGPVIFTFHLKKLALIIQLFLVILNGHIIHMLWISNATNLALLNCPNLCVLIFSLYFMTVINLYN